MGDDRASWYELAGGRRNVVPYLHPFASNAKRRWVGRRVIDVMLDEFPHGGWSAAYFEQASAAGQLTLNGRPAVLEDVFRDGDRFVHTVCRTEPSVPSSAPIEMLLCDDDLLAINKPAGVPVHHAGQYRRNTVVEILQTERPELALGGSRGTKGGLHVLHRLDRQVSGVLLFPRTAATASVLHSALSEGHMRKRYLARVAGLMQPGTKLTVSAPIRVVSANGATSADCHEDGKPASTLVACIGCDPATGTSLLLCEPLSGRMHQVRLHLQRLGHSIANDPAYTLPIQAPAGAPPSSVAGQISGAISGVKPAAAAADLGCKRARLSEEGASAAVTIPPTAARPPAAAPAVARESIGEPGDEAEAVPGIRVGSAEQEAACDELWLHAWSYSCGRYGARPFDVMASPPSWTKPFAPLPSLALLDADAAPIALESARGQAMLAECDAADRVAYDWLWPAFQRQRGATMCGAASIAIVLRAAQQRQAAMGADANAVLPQQSVLAVAAARLASTASGGVSVGGHGALADEESVLDGQQALPASKVRKCGMTLPEAGLLLQGLDVPHVVSHARGEHTAAGPAVSAPEEIAAQRRALADLKSALRGAPASAVVVNYHLGVVGHRPFGGHFSPLAAYHAPSGRFLVLDCWPHTPPGWYSADLLWASMAGTDAESGRSRGWLLLGDDLAV